MKKIILLIVCLYTISLCLKAQTTKFVQSDVIELAVHKENIGRIAFMSQVIPIEAFTMSDFLTSFELKEKTDFNIRVFLGNSLTNYLHFLAPNYTADELTKNGNYQFAFFVDGKKIYTENLPVGAGSAEGKNRQTVFRVPLISSKNEDSWGRFLWNRFMMQAGQEAFTSGEHLLKIEIRPYLKINELLVGEIIAEGQISIIVPEVKINEKLVKVQEIKPLKDWQIATDSFDHDKIEALNRKIATQTFKEVTSIVVIKNGKLLIEEYFNGANRNTLHDTRSVGKSFASVLLGVAIRDGYIKNEKQTLNNFYDLKTFENYNQEKERITLEDLLTMQSVFDGNDMDNDSPGNEEKMYPTKNWVAFALNLPVDETKIDNKCWDYFTAGVVILGDVLQQSVPEGLYNYADKNLFQPLGIAKYKWQYTPQKVANTAGSLQLRSLDYAKFGQLYKNQGNWNGTQIFSTDWATKSLSKQATISDEDFYGYLFWNKTYHVDGSDYEVYYASGNGGNKIFIFRDLPLVIVITSKAYNKPYGHSQSDKIVEQYLIPALKYGFSEK